MFHIHKTEYDWQAWLDTDQIKYLGLYKSSSFEQINHFLRTGVFIKDNHITTVEEMQKCVYEIDRAMIPVKKEMRVFRCFAYDLNKLLEDGHEVHNSSYTSTSLDIQKAAIFHQDGKSNCLFDLTLPPSVRAYPFYKGNEQEILLERGWKISYIHYNGNKKYGGLPKFCFTGTMKKMTKEEIHEEKVRAADAHRLEMEIANAIKERAKQTEADYLASIEKELMETAE